MALFMDVHNIEGGAAASDVANAHQADLATQGAYGVNYVRYWVEKRQARSSALSKHRMRTSRTLFTDRLMGS
jgi:hypothetical protein